jgi:hypothetical protein
MSAVFWLPMLVRAVATALLVMCAAALAETLGPFWGALIASLPVSVGPSYLFLSLQHDRDFLAASALSSFAANAATALFLITYGFQARKASLWRSLGVACAVWLVASVATRQIDWTPAAALVLNLVVFGIGFYLLDPADAVAPGASPTARRRWYDIPVRGLGIAAFVSVIVIASSMLGAQATGVAAVFPVSLISVIVIVHPRLGGMAGSRLAANALRGMLGFGVMLLTLHLTLRPWGIAGALPAALLVSAGWSGGLMVWRRLGAIPAGAKLDSSV